MRVREEKRRSHWEGAEAVQLKRKMEKIYTPGLIMAM
jgi:hypothetical protein